MTARYIESFSFSQVQSIFYHLHLSSPFTPQTMNRAVIGVTLTH